MKTNRENVFEAISQERLHQDRKWGTVEERPHTVAEWILIAEAELAEAKHAWTKECSDHKALEELLQVATVIVAALEQNQMKAINIEVPAGKRNYTLIQHRPEEELF